MKQHIGYALMLVRSATGIVEVGDHGMIMNCSVRAVEPIPMHMGSQLNMAYALTVRNIVPMNVGVGW